MRRLLEVGHAGRRRGGPVGPHRDDTGAHLGTARESGLDESVQGKGRPADDALMRRAVARVEAVTAAHSRSLTIASRLLPARKPQAGRALYSFCRTTDDRVERPSRDADSAVDPGRSYHPGDGSGSQDRVAIAWADATQRFRIPSRLKLQ